MTTSFDPPGFNLYRFQRRSLPVLLGWSAASMLAGAFWRRSAEPGWRALGTQFIGWGLVDGLIALAGLRGAASKEAQLHQGMISLAEQERQARQFSALLAANTGLDVVYVLAGRRLVSRADGDRAKIGTGVGVMVQGLFLFFWDLVLWALLSRKRNNAS